MAAATAVVSQQGSKMFRGVFSEMWVVTCTLDASSAAAGAQTTSDTITVPGVAVGDMVIGISSTAEVAASPELSAPVSLLRIRSLLL